MEGNIGAGKTTFIQKLATELNAVVVNETWDDTLLKGFYEGNQTVRDVEMDFARRKVYAYQEAVGWAERGLVVIVERSPWGQQPFIAHGVDTGKLTSEDVMHLRFWCEPVHLRDPDYLIFMECFPTECYRRVQERGRSSEATITSLYLTQLNQKMAEWRLGFKLHVPRTLVYPPHTSAHDVAGSIISCRAQQPQICKHFSCPGEAYVYGSKLGLVKSTTDQPSQQTTHPYGLVTSQQAYPSSVPSPDPSSCPSSSLSSSS